MSDQEVKIKPTPFLEIFEGVEAAKIIDQKGSQCSCCGFMEERLVAFKHSIKEVSVLCKECFDQDYALPEAEYAEAYLPEMPKAAFSHYLRSLTFVTFAARVGAINDHQFADGTVPEAFQTAYGWNLPLKWDSLTAGIADKSTDEIELRGLLLAKKSFEFLKARTACANQRIITDKQPDDQVTKLEIEGTDLRRYSKSTDLDRIRTWGKPGSSFRIISRQNKK